MMNENPAKQRYKIGQLAGITNAKIQTLRFYEKQGLLKNVNRTESGYRIYSSEHLLAVRFIKNAQGLGFSLAEIKQLLWLQQNSAKDRKSVRKLAGSKIANIEARIKNLKKIRRSLVGLMDRCSGTDTADPCPIIESIKNNKNKEIQNEKT